MFRFVRWFSIFSAVLIVGSGINLTARTGSTGKISTSLQKSKDGKPQKAWVYFKNRTTKDPQRLSLQVNPLAQERRMKAGMAAADSLDAPVDARYWKVLETQGARIRTVTKWFNAVSVDASADQLRQISELPFVERVERVHGSRKTLEKATPVQMPPASPTLYRGGIDYGHSRDQVYQIGVTELHARKLSGKGVVIAMLDTCFKLGHEAFSKVISENRLKAQWDFVGNDGNVDREPGENDNCMSAGSVEDHGTMTWSNAGGYAPGRIVGPAYNATFLLAHSEDVRSETPIEEDYWIASLEWAESHGANIVSSSLGYRDFDNNEGNHGYDTLDGQTLMISRAANIAMERGVFVVNSVGNEGEGGAGTLSAPSDAFGAFAIGAVAKSGSLAYFSSQGPTADGRIKPDVVARGVRNYVATYNGYGQADGTSFSAPLVAGTAALLLEAHPDWAAAELMQAFRSTASQADKPDNQFGYGLVDAVKALEYRAAPLNLASAR